MHQGRKARGCHLAGYLGDANWAPKLVRRLAAGYHATEVGHRAVDDEPSFPGAQADGRQRAHRLELDVVGGERTAYAENSDTVDVAEIVLDLLEGRNRLESHLAITPFDHHCKGVAGACADDTLHISKAVDDMAVYRQDNVTGLESGRGSGAVRRECVDPSERALLDVNHEHAYNKYDRQDENR